MRDVKHELWDDGDVDDEASVRSHPLNQIDVGAVPLVVSGIIVSQRVIRPDVASSIGEVADSEDGATQVIKYDLAREAVWVTTCRVAVVARRARMRQCNGST